MKKKYLYLPLEIAIREFDGKATLAYEAAKRGWNVIITNKLKLYSQLKNLPKGIFLVKSAVPGEINQLKKIKKYGHKILLLDEEGVVTYEIFLKGNYRYNKDTLSLVDSVFLWGEKQKSILTESYPEFKEKAHVTSNPRYEFWQKYASKTYEDEILTIKKKYGDFLFLPTSFGIANNYLSGEGVKSSINDMRGRKFDDISDFLEGQFEINLIAFKEYLSFLEDLIYKFKDTNIIVRPHPSESESLWRKLESKFSNLHVIYENSVTPWLLACKVMIHFKSTTSIESNLLKIPTVTYMPSIPEYLRKFELDLPKKASIVTRTREDTIKVLDDIFSSNDVSRMHDIGETDWLSKNLSSSEKIMSYIEESKTFTDESIIFKRSFGAALRKFYEEILIYLNKNSRLRSILPKRLIRHPDRLIYGQRKEGGLDIKHLMKIIKVINNSSDQPVDIKVIDHSSNFFEISLDP